MLRSLMSFRVWLTAGFAAAALAWPQADSAQAPTVPVRESAVKAAFLYKFGSFVNWPAGTFASSGAPLVFGVVGEDAVAEELEQLAAGRTVEGRPVRVRTFRDGETPSAVHVLFVGDMRPPRLRDLFAAVPGPVLFVSQQEGALRAGSMINFLLEGTRIRFAVSLASAEARGIRLSARLLTVAQSVEGRSH